MLYVYHLEGSNSKIFEPEASEFAHFVIRFYKLRFHISVRKLVCCINHYLNISS